MERAEFSSGEALSLTWSLICTRPQVVLLVITALAALGIGSDLLPDNAGLRLTAPLGIVSLFAQYFVTRDRLDALDLIPDGFRANRVLALLGVGILTTLGIVAGAVLLIIPGIFLAVRWALAAPILIAEDVGVTAAIGRSWQETEGRFWTIVVVLLVVYSPILLLAVAGGVAAVIGAENSFVLTIIINVGANAVVVAGWIAMVALYALTQRGRGGVSDIFA